MAMPADVDGGNRALEVEAADRHAAENLVFQPPIGGADAQRAVGAAWAPSVEVSVTEPVRAGRSTPPKSKPP